MASLRIILSDCCSTLCSRFLVGAVVMILVSFLAYIIFLACRRFVCGPRR